MTQDVKLDPGWLKRDIERAAGLVSDAEGVGWGVSMALRVLRDHDMHEEAEELLRRAH